MSMRDKVNLEVQVAGPNAASNSTNQFDGTGGRRRHYCFPFPDCFKPGRTNACNRGVLVIAYDGEITEPALIMSISTRKRRGEERGMACRQLDGKATSSC